MFIFSEMVNRLLGNMLCACVFISSPVPKANRGMKPVFVNLLVHQMFLHVQGVFMCWVQSS